MTLARYTDGGLDGWMQTPTGEFVRFQDCQVEVKRLTQDNYRLTMRCWAMAHLLYPQGNAPREAVEGHI